MTPRVPGRRINLGGVLYLVPCLSLAQLEANAEKLEQITSLEEDPKGFLRPGVVGSIIDLAYVAMRRNYPELTRETLASQVGIGDLARLIPAILGAQVQEDETGEAPGPASA